jgi:uncharacterized protein YcbX
MSITVTGLLVTPVKGLRVRSVPSIVLDRGGAQGNRRFYVIDDRGRMINAKHLGALNTISADCSDGRLTLEFPDGQLVTAPVQGGGLVNTLFFSVVREATVLDGPWHEALSEFTGQSLRIVEPVDGGVDRGAAGAVSLISRGSLQRLAEVAGEQSVDGRRFRMLIEIDGVTPHAEDGWIATRTLIGDATIAWRGHVGRCIVTSRNPETGEVDLPTLDLLGSYRRGLGTTEPLPFGIYGSVLEGGEVTVGDAVTAANSTN